MIFAHQSIKLLNAKNPDEPKTVKQIADKIQYMQRTAKAKNAAKKKSNRLTGGGSDKTKALNPIDDKFVAALGETPGFNGICGGIESGGENLATNSAQSAALEEEEEEDDPFLVDRSIDRLNESSENLGGFVLPQTNTESIDLFTSDTPNTAPKKKINAKI